MRMRWQAAIGVALLLSVGCLSSPALAGDFFSSLFGAFFHPPVPSVPMMLPFGEDGPPPMEGPRPRVAFGGGPAWCVRSCDGRYFPITGPDAQSNCNSFCPASKTDVVYGNDIDHAATATGKPYSELPNAFKYRTEMVAGCTCNGKDPVGLASVAIANDPTIRRGDIVAAADGLVIAHPGARGHAELNFTPVPKSIRARFKYVPVMAKE